MFAALSDTLIHLPRLFRRTQPFPLHILLPGLAVLAVWSLVRVWHDDATQAFMIAFTTGVALRLAMKSGGMIAQIRARFSPAVTVALVMALGPGALVLLIIAADPIYCQRYITLSILITAALYLLDIASGDPRQSQQRWPQDEMRVTDQAMTRAMAVHSLGLAILNETLIGTVSAASWLLAFALMPLLTNILRTAIVRAVTEPVASVPARPRRF